MIIYLNQLLATIGLFMGIFGAFWLSRAIMHKDIAKISSENRSIYEGFPVPSRLLSEIKQRAEAEVGFGMLFFGFSMQIISVFAPKIELHMVWIIIVFVVLVTVFLLSERLVENKFCFLGKKMLKNCEEEIKNDNYLNIIRNVLEKKGCNQYKCYMRSLE